MAEVVRQLQRHQVVLQHEEVEREVLDPVVDVPWLANTFLDQMLLVDEELIAFDRAPWHEKNVRVFYVDRVLEQQLLDNHLY